MYKKKLLQWCEDRDVFVFVFVCVCGMNPRYEGVDEGKYVF